MRLHEKLEKLRDERGISVRELARKIGVASDTTVGRWLSGESEPRFSEVVRLAALFAVPLDSLVDEGAESPPASNLTDDERFVLRSFRALKIDAEVAVRRMAGRVAIEPGWDDEAVSGDEPKERQRGVG